MRSTRPALLAAAAALAACGVPEFRDTRESAISIPPPEGAVTAADPEVRDRYAVRAVGQADDTLAEVEAQLLRQAARLTLDTGNDWFRVVARDVDSTTRFGRASSGAAGASFGPVFYSRGYRDMDLATGVSEPVVKYEVSADILVRNYPAPDDDPSAHDARRILRTGG